MSAKTESENIVKMITSRRFFTDSMTAPTMVFKPVNGIKKRGEKKGGGFIQLRGKSKNLSIAKRCID